jgi:hypothetical protein
MHNSASDELVLADLRESMGDGFSVAPPPPYDPIGMAWANGRRCTVGEDPGPATPTVFLWADGTPLRVYPQPPSAREWRATVAKHGLPMTANGVTLGSAGSNSVEN